MEVDEIKEEDLHREEDLGLNPGVFSIRSCEEKKEPAKEIIKGNPMRLETNQENEVY